MQMTINQFLTDENIQDCIEIYKANPDRAVKRIKNEVILPNLEVINKRIGQKNDATYLAYAIYCVLSKATS